MRSKVRSDKKRTRAIPHNSKCRYGERGAADAKPKAQIILDAAKVSAASGGNSEPKQGSGRRVRGLFAPKYDAGYRNPTLSSILATQMPCHRRSGAFAVRRGIVRCCPTVRRTVFTPFTCLRTLPVPGPATSVADLFAVADSNSGEPQDLQSVPIGHSGKLPYSF